MGCGEGRDRAFLAEAEAEGVDDFFTAALLAAAADLPTDGAFDDVGDDSPSELRARLSRSSSLFLSFLPAMPEARVRTRLTSLAGAPSPACYSR